jgi:hypothetical protein
VAQDFNLKATQASGRNVASGFPLRPAVDLLLNAPALGLRPATLIDVASQLVSERRRPWRKVRRRTYQTVLLFDVFAKQLRSTRPGFASFFSNHVASAQHRFWAGSFPRDYDELELGEDWMGRFSEEIPFAMEKFDGFLSSLVAFVERNPEYRLVVASSMGQGAIEVTAVKKKLYLKDAGRFAQALGLGTGDWEQKPAMEPTVNLQVDAARAAAFREQLGALRIDGKAVFFREREGGFFNLVFGQSDLPEVVPIVELRGQKHLPRELGLESVEVEDGSDGTAYHVPEGILMIFDPAADRPREGRPQISALEVAPAVLRGFGAAVPAYMREGAIPELSGV